MVREKLDSIPNTNDNNDEIDEDKVVGNYFMIDRTPFYNFCLLSEMS